MKFTIAVIPGDGIGPEVTNQAKKALDAVADVYNHVFLYKEAEMGACAIEKTGNPLPEKTIEICKKADAILFGAIGAPKYDNDPTAKVRPEQGLLQLRKELGLYCSVSPVKAYDKLIKNSPLKQDIILGTDLVIYRELTGGIYFGEKELSKDEQSAFDICSYSVKEISRITHLAFKAAQGRRKKVTLIDKADVLETSRLWRKTVAEIAKEYKDVTLNFLFADNASMQLILNPKQFDVILTENMFGDILSEEASVIVGSIGLMASFHTIIFAFGRQIYSLSRAGYFPVFLSLTHSKRKTPYTALILGAVIGFVVLLVTHYLTGDESEVFVGGALLNIAVFSAMLSYILQSGSFILLRKKRPDLERPYRSPFGNPGAWVTIFLACAIIYYQLQDESYRTAVFIAMAYLVLGLLYFAFKGRHNLILSPEEEFALEHQDNMKN